MCTVISSKTPGDFTGEKLKAYNFVISGWWVKTLQVLKRNSGYDSHYATPSSFPILRSASEMTYIVSGGALNSTHSVTPHPPTSALPFLTRVWGYHHGKIVELDVWMYVLEHFDGLVRLIIFPWNKQIHSPPYLLNFCRPRISVTHFASPGVPLDANGCGGSDG